MTHSNEEVIKSRAVEMPEVDGANAFEEVQNENNLIESEKCKSQVINTFNATPICKPTTLNASHIPLFRILANTNTTPLFRWSYCT